MTHDAPSYYAKRQGYKFLRIANLRLSAIICVTQTHTYINVVNYSKQTATIHVILLILKRRIPLPLNTKQHRYVHMLSNSVFVGINIFYKLDIRLRLFIK